ncbi:MAG: transcription termination factor Rho [Planctomycetota bacterium]|nr:MAG: transcription termination factor Rho [Planctomycetota bacterium]
MTEPASNDATPRRRRRRRRKRRRTQPTAGRPTSTTDDAAQPCTGIFEPARRGDGRLRDEARSYAPRTDDPVVPAPLVQRHALRAGSRIEGACTQGRRGERTLVRIDRVDGLEPDEARRIEPLSRQTSITPEQLIVLEDEEGDLTLRAVDLIAPIGRGQRALIVAPPRSGKTVLLEKIARRIDRGYPDIDLIVLLVNERPEEVTHFRRTIERGTVIASSSDEPNERHVQVTELAGARAARLAELGRDVVLMIDSLTRVGRAFNAAITGKGRTLSGGLDTRALERPRAIFGAARNVEGGGSLTIIATALIETGSRMDEVIFEEFKGTGNMELVLDRSLAERRIFPAIDVERSGTRREERLLDPYTLEAIHTLRRVLARAPRNEATALLLERMRQTPDNPAFIHLLHGRAS